MHTDPFPKFQGFPINKMLFRPPSPPPKKNGPLKHLVDALNRKILHILLLNDAEWELGIPRNLYRIIGNMYREWSKKKENERNEATSSFGFWLAHI